MKVLLLSSNQAVQRLVEMTLQKIQSSVKTLGSLAEIPEDLGEFDLIIVDDVVFDDGRKHMFFSFQDQKVLLLYSEVHPQSSICSASIKKPFLPNELLKVLNVLQQQGEKQEGEAEEKSVTKVFESQETSADPESDMGLDELFEDLDAREISENTREFPEVVDSKESNEREGASLELRQSGVFDPSEIEKIQGLLQQTQKKSQEDDLAILSQIIKTKNPESLRGVLDGMQLTINISFPKRDVGGD